MGKGTTFLINLPILDQKEGMRGEKKLVEMKKVTEGGEGDSEEDNLIGG